MGIITAITMQKKNKTRVNLYMDDEFVCGLDAFTVQAHRLKTGMELSKDALDALVFDSECESSFAKAVGLIQIRMRSQCEVVRYLTQKAYSAAVIERTVQKLTEYGFLDDAKFAAMYTQSYRSRWGLKKIAYELRNLGIAPDVVEEVMQQTEPQEEEAYRLAVRYKGNKTELDKRKLYAHLAQKGFDSEVIRAAIERLMQQQETDDAEDAD